jgi:hypothetical protein
MAASAISHISPHRLRAALATLVLVVACLVFAWRVGEFYPLKYWLLPRYLKYWALSAGLGCACLVSGLRLTAALGGKALRFGDNLLISFASGVLLFSLGVFVAGILGLFGPVFFFLWPALLTLLAGRAPWRTLGLAASRFNVAARSGELSIWPRTPFELARALFLVLGLVGVYLQVITPGNLSFDARWYHVSIAEQYAFRGAIERFPEGWYLGAYPQLATWLYTWAFLLPGSLFDHVALAAHVEWLLFLATVPAIGLVVRHLLQPDHVRWTGGALFLFPSIYIYDTNLNVGSDHVLAFWAGPLALAVIALVSQPSAKRVLLASLPAAGALLTRYQAIYLLVPASLILLYALVRARKLRLIALGIASVLVLTAPHWLKNIIFYGDPLYPVLNAYLPARPFHPEAADAMLGQYLPTVFAMTGTVWERLCELAPALATFSFIGHNWSVLNLPQPTFGSLFTLLGVALPFVPRARRIWGLLLVCYVGVGIWYWTNHQIRFLQALVPWMAACVVALCVRIWQLGAAPRIALTALVGLQIVWGADFYFAPNHTLMDDGGIIAHTAKHLRAGIGGDYESRFRHFMDFEKVNARLPGNAVVLLHNGDFRLGLERRAITDQWGYQGALSYRALGDPRAVWQAWHDLGVTHIYWPRGENKDASVDEKARESVFRRAVKKITRRRERLGGSFLAELAPEPPP